MSEQIPATPAVESRQHALPFADRCMVLRIDDQEDPESLSLHAIALTEAAYATVRGITALASVMPESNPEREIFIANTLTLVEFALGAAVALQFDAHQTNKADDLERVARAGDDK